MKAVRLLFLFLPNHGGVVPCEGWEGGVARLAGFQR